MTIVCSCICSALFADPPDGRRDSVLLAASHASSPCVGISRNIRRSFHARMAAVSTVRRSKAVREIGVVTGRRRILAWKKLGPVLPALQHPSPRCARSVPPGNHANHTLQPGEPMQTACSCPGSLQHMARLPQTACNAGSRSTVDCPNAGL
jgi:hypothetical protein